MNKIVVLGDCQSNGNNCLAHQVFPDKKWHTWSLKYHDNFPEVFKWYKNNNKKFGNTPVKQEHLKRQVWNYYRNAEKSVAWPNYLDGWDVINLSINGAHFLGYHSRLKLYLEKNDCPDHVIITDYTFSHIASVIRSENDRYIFETSHYADNDWNPALHCHEVHLKRLSDLKFQKNQTIQWHIRRHGLAFQQLVKLLDAKKISWSVMRFGDLDPENIRIFDVIMGNQIDCTRFFHNYRYFEGEDSWKKLSAQLLIAETVKNYLTKTLNHIY
jgi:hypothetical protein